MHGSPPSRLCPAETRDAHGNRRVSVSPWAVASVVRNSLKPWARSGGAAVLGLLSELVSVAASRTAGPLVT